MKALLVSCVVFVPLCMGPAQTVRTNGTPAPAAAYQLLSISNVVKVASGLRAGMPGAEAHKYLQGHGLTQTNVYSLSVDRGRTMKCPYPLAGGATLMLEMHCTSAPPGLFGWSNPVLDRAYIQSQGTNTISIKLTNGP